MFTTRSGSASPIQRTFVGFDSFSVFQEVFLKTSDPRVSNIVKFSEAIGDLKVEALATIKDGNEFFSNLIEQHFLSNFYHSRFRTLYLLDFWEMKLRDGS